MRSDTTSAVRAMVAAAHDTGQAHDVDGAPSVEKELVWDVPFIQFMCTFHP